MDALLNTVWVLLHLQMVRLRISYISGCFHSGTDGSAAGAGRGCGHLLPPSHPSLFPPLHPGDSCQVDGQLCDHYMPTTQNPPQQPGDLFMTMSTHINLLVEICAAGKI